MFQRRNGNAVFGIASVLMIVLGLGNAMLGVVLEKFFPALDPQSAVKIAPALLMLWMLTMVIWLMLLVGLIRRNRPRRRAARHRNRTSSRQPIESTMQGQWRQNDTNRAWMDATNDTRERIDRTERKAMGAQNATTASKYPPARIDFVAGPDVFPAPELPRPSAWTLALLQELEWHRFEQVCAGFLVSLGLEARSLAGGPDSPVSLQIWQPGNATMHAIAKTHSGASTVEVECIRALFKVQTGYQLKKAFSLSAGSFSPEALAAGRDVGLVLIDGAAMLAHLLTMNEAQCEALLLMATSGNYRSPTCPACASKMVMCSGDFKSFWRCSDYPVCKSRLTLAGDRSLLN